MYYNSLNFFDAMNDGKSDVNREKEEKLMMKKLAAVSVVLILMLALFTSCDKEKKDSSKKENPKGESTESESIEESSEETDYHVKADPELTDESAVLRIYDSSLIENIALYSDSDVVKTIELDGTEGAQLRKKLDEIKWYSGSAVDFAFQQWFDAELQYEDQTDKYYISFGSKSILHVAKDTEGLYGSMSDELLESMVKICPERTEKLEFDENGCLTAASCAEYAKKCVKNFLKKSERAGYSADDDINSYVVTINNEEYIEDKPGQTDIDLGKAELVTVIVEKEKNWYSYFMFLINRKWVGVEGGGYMSGKPDEYRVEFTQYSYEGLETKPNYESNKDNEFTDGHYKYIVDDNSRCLRSVLTIDGYKAAPVNDIIADAKTYLEKLFPGYSGEIGDWEIEDGKTKIVKYMNDIYGYPVQMAGFVYDEENRLTGASMNMELLTYIKNEEELIKLDKAVELAEGYIKKDYPELGSDYNVTAKPEMSNGILVWIVRFGSGERVYTCVLDAVTGEMNQLGFEIADE